MLKGAIFDLDGTLLDSMGVWERIDIQFLSSRGFDVPGDYAQTIAPMGFLQAAEYTIRRFSLPDTPMQLVQEWNTMAERAYRETVPLKPFVREYLSFLKERHVPLAVATASQEILYKAALENNGIYDFFDAFTTLADVRRGKGFPDIYLHAAYQLGLPPEQCAVFEDIYEGVIGARSGGFYTVGVYDPCSEKEKQKMQKEADLFIESFAQLLAQPGLLQIGLAR